MIQSPDWTLAFLDHPWLGSVVWFILHSTDYFLTVYGSNLYRAGARKVIELGSYELNPVFRAAVDQGKWLPRSFVVSLFAGGLLLYPYAWACARTTTGLEWLFAVVMGSIVFSRVGIISQHLNNIWLFKRVMQPNSPVAGAIRYDEETSYFVTARVHRTWAFLVGSAFCFAP